MQQTGLRQTSGLLLNRVIDTPKITLQPISLEFISEIHSGYTHEVAKFLYAQPCKKLSDTARRIEFAIEQMRLGLQSNFQIRDNETDSFIGCANVRHHKPKSPPRLAFWLKEEWQHRGFGTETYMALKKYIDSTLIYEFLVIKILDENIAAKHLLKKIGAKELDEIFMLKINEHGVKNRLITYRIYR